MSPPEHPTRQAVLYAATHAAMHETGLSLADLSESIAVVYCGRVPPEHRGISLQDSPRGDDADAYFRWKDSTRRQIERFLSDAVRLPVELEEAWIQALPSPYRERAVHQLTHRLGYLPVAIPDHSQCTVEQISQILAEHAEAVQTSAPMVGDGQLDDADRPHAGDSYREHLEAAAAHLGLAFRIRERFPEETRDADTGVLDFPGQKAG